jgi:hypothetical protein
VLIARGDGVVGGGADSRGNIGMIGGSVGLRIAAGFGGMDAAVLLGMDASAANAGAGETLTHEQT